MKSFFLLPLDLRLFIFNSIWILFPAITTGLITFYFFTNKTETFYTSVLEIKENKVLAAFNQRILDNGKVETIAD